MKHEIIHEVKFLSFTNYALCYSLFIGVLGGNYTYNLEDN